MFIKLDQIEGHPVLFKRGQIHLSDDNCYTEAYFWNQEIEEHRAKNSRISEDSVRDFSNSRWKIYHKRIEKLKEEHLRYETNRLSLLKEGLIKAFNLDIWEEIVEKCDGDETKLYNEYKIETIKRKNL